MCRQLRDTDPDDPGRRIDHFPDVDVVFESDVATRDRDLDEFASRLVAHDDDADVDGRIGRHRSTLMSCVHVQS